MKPFRPGESQIEIDTELVPHRIASPTIGLKRECEQLVFPVGDETWFPRYATGATPMEQWILLDRVSAHELGKRRHRPRLLPVLRQPQVLMMRVTSTWPAESITFRAIQVAATVVEKFLVEWR